MFALKDIRSLTEFQRDTKAHLRRLKETGKPEVLTVNGKAELVVVNAEAFEEMIDTVRGIQRGLDEMAVGQGQPVRQGMEEIRIKYRIPKKA